MIRNVFASKARKAEREPLVELKFELEYEDK